MKYDIKMFYEYADGIIDTHVFRDVEDQEINAYVEKQISLFKRFKVRDPGAQLVRGLVLVVPSTNPNKGGNKNEL